jgi:hypothetical protein
LHRDHLQQDLSYHSILIVYFSQPQGRKALAVFRQSSFNKVDISIFQDDQKAYYRYQKQGEYSSL